MKVAVIGPRGFNGYKLVKKTLGDIDDVSMIIPRGVKDAAL